ncbi:MAG TPA: hypothetical protein VKV36_12960 [Acidimicrobiales bacterium]|nr:hypothetical protein [Acidimicrobiales bacterium]
MPRRRVAIVPHTHWDREWYEPFQTFRMRLVEVLDGLLDILESDPSYTCFLLDGQMAAVDDYLEIRPDAAPRLRDLAVSGRLSIGPWYVLMDEFLVSGETIVRNLQMGLARAADFGGAMPVGYLPDMFGHIAQMPQLLCSAGFEHAVVWRGVPAAITANAFWWEAPDGSRVRAEYLPVGYSNAASLPDDAKALVRRIADHEQEVSTFLLDGLLCMNGSDHAAPQGFLGRRVAEANAAQEDFALSIVSLPEYLRSAPHDGLATWRGELRSGARANLLMGVTSNRVDVKRAAALAERALERRAEPYSAFFLDRDHRWPGRLLELAWRKMVHNSAHDSICACSVDQVVDAVQARFAEARQIADGVAARALRALAVSMAEAGPVVVNPSARQRSGVVELLAGAELAKREGVQVLSERSGLPGSMTIDAATARTVLELIQGPRLGDDAWVHDVRVDEDSTGIDLTVTIGPEERPGVPVAEAKQDLYTRLGARPQALVRITLDQPPIFRVAARVAEVPAFGWRLLAPGPLRFPASATGSDGGDPGPVVLANGLVTVVVDPEDGTFSVEGIPGFGRVVESGDLGDSYNYSPPAADTRVDTPSAVAVTVVERGPVRATAEIVATYRWPDHVDGATQARVGEHEVAVTTRVTLHADERTIRVATSFLNPCRDHRVRVHLPLPEPATVSVAGTAFASVTRGLTAEGRAEETGLPTFPARDFVAAGGLTVLLDAVREYELVDVRAAAEGPRAHTLALTALRATGMLSRLGMAYRPLPAGPLTPAEGLQLVGRQVVLDYGLELGDVDPYAAADDLFVPLEVAHAPGGGWRAPSGSALVVTGAEVSSVRRVAGALEVRVFNPTDRPSTVEIGGHGWLVDLRGRPLEAFDGSFELRAHGIATARLAEA